MNFNEVINKVQSSGNMKTPNTFNASNSSGDMMDKLNRVNQHGSPVNQINSRDTSSLANKGRFGDTEIRDVDGKPAHVNPYEAYMIDNYGATGEQITKNIGSGTTNPATGLKEYGWLSDFLDQAWTDLTNIFPHSGTGWFSGSPSDATIAQENLQDSFDTSIEDFGERTEASMIKHKQERMNRLAKLNEVWRDKFLEISDVDAGSFEETGSIQQKKDKILSQLSSRWEREIEDFNYSEDVDEDTWLANQQAAFNQLIADSSAGVEAMNDAYWYLPSTDPLDTSDVSAGSYVFQDTPYEIG